MTQRPTATLGPTSGVSAADEPQRTERKKKPRSTSAKPKKAAQSAHADTAAHLAPVARVRRRKSGHGGSPTTPVVVTGAASGIGRATCVALAAAGRAVGAWDRDGAEAEVTAKQCRDEFGVQALAIEVDVADAEALQAAALRTVHTLGGVGGLVHAAGVPGPGPVTMVDEEMWDAVLDVNLRAGATLIRLLAPALQEDPGGAVVLVSSIEGLHGHGMLAAYCASKSGVLGLMRSAAHALGGVGVRVNAVCPGAIDTPMLASVLAMPEARERILARTPLQRIGEPVDVARAIRFLLSDDAGFITGVALVVDGGMTAIGGGL